MGTTLDGENLFNDQQLQISTESAHRDCIERKVAGLNGMLSIDLGGRGRAIKQKGVLRAQSSEQLNERIEAISAYHDGDSHTLVTADGQSFENIRIDTFRIKNIRAAGSGICCDYEIVYTQLVV